MATPLWNLPEIAASLAQEHTTLNEITRKIEGRFSVKDRDLTAPPGSPAEGDTYLVPPSGATGAWAGLENNIVILIGAAWAAIAPSKKNPILYVEDESIHLFWNGTAYAQISGGGGGADEKAKVSLNDTTAGYLNGKLVAGVNITLTENNDGGNETLTIAAAAASGSTYSAPFRGALVQLSASQAITGDSTWQTVSWGSEQFDTDSFWSAGSPTIFTIASGITRAQLRASAYFADGLSWPVEIAIRNVTTGTDVAYAQAVGTDPMSVEAETPVISVTAGHTYAVRLKSTADRTLSSGVLTWFAIEVIELQEATAPDGKLLVSANDTTRGYLADKLTVSGGLVKTETDDGANESLDIALPAQPYDLAIFIPGKPASGQVITKRLPRAVTFPAGLPSSQGGSEVAATAEFVVSLQKGGVEFGTLTIAAAGAEGTFASASGASFAAGEKLAFVMPGTPDATLEGLDITLAGLR